MYMPSFKTPLLMILAAYGVLQAHAQSADANGEVKANLSVGINRTNSSLLKGLTIQSRSALLLDANYEQGNWYASMQNGLGYKLLNSPSLKLGVSANYMPGRYVVNDTRYKGMGDVSGTLSGYAWAEWRPVKDVVTVYGNIARSARSANGMLATAGSTIGFPVYGKLNGFVDM